MSEIAKESYKKLDALLQQNGITAYALAKATNLPKATLYEWKSGKSQPKVDKLKLIADYFGVPVTYFIE